MQCLSLMCNGTMLTWCSQNSTIFLHCFWHTYSQSTAFSIIHTSLHPSCRGWQWIWVLGMLGKKDRWHHSAVQSTADMLGLSTGGGWVLGDSSLPSSDCIGMICLCMLGFSLTEACLPHNSPTTTIYFRNSTLLKNTSSAGCWEIPKISCNSMFVCILHFMWGL